MKRKYLILVAGPERISEINEQATHQKTKMQRLIDTLLPYKASSQLLRSSTHMTHHACAAKIAEVLRIHEHTKTQRFNWSYKTENRHAYIEKYYLKQILADIQSNELVIYVGYNSLTRDIAEYFDPKSPIIRIAGCDHCQAVVLEYTDHMFIIKEYLNLGE